MKVLIVPEDPTHDQYILKPIVERIFEDLARIARVEVLFDPHLRGVDQTLNREMIREIIIDRKQLAGIAQAMPGNRAAQGADCRLARGMTGTRGARSGRSLLFLVLLLPKAPPKRGFVSPTR